MQKLVHKIILEPMESARKQTKWFIFSLYLLSPIAVMAERLEPVIPEGPSINPAQGVESPADFLAVIQNVLGWAFAFALILGVAMLIAAGIMYITSAGSARSKTAVQIMIAAIIGIAIAGFAWAIVNVIQGLFFEEQIDVGTGI